MPYRYGPKDYNWREPLDPQWVRTWPQRLATAGDAVWFYLGKLLWPHPLIDHLSALADRCRTVDFVFAAASCDRHFFYFLAQTRALVSRLFFCFRLFHGGLAAGLGLIDNYIFHYSLVFDHFQYLASIGPLALAGTGLARFRILLFRGRPWLQSGLCAGLLLILGMASWQRAWVYDSEETLWSDTLAKNPNCWVGHNNLGVVFLKRGQIDEAVEEFQKALEINPNYKEAHSNLGIALVQKGQVDEAIAQYQKVLEIDPNFLGAYSNLGIALAQKGQLDEAIAEYQKALEINPNQCEGHYNLGSALFQKGQLDEAIAQYQKALEINPNYAEAHNNLGNALIKKGQLDEATEQYQMAVKINPKYCGSPQQPWPSFPSKGTTRRRNCPVPGGLTIEPRS